MNKEKKDLKILVEQYKAYISTIVNNTNKKYISSQFFLTIISALITAIMLSIKLNNHEFIIFLLCILGMLICLIWSKSIKVYKTINFNKYKVLKELERELPFDLFEKEWILIKDKLEFKNEQNGDYKTSTDFEMKTPFFFFFFFVCILLFEIYLIFMI